MALCTGMMAHCKTEWWLSAIGQVAQTTQDYSDNLRNIIHIYDKSSDGTYELTNYYEYDESNQLVRENDVKQNVTKVYTYDLGGNIISIQEYEYTTDTLGEVKNTITYEYNDANWKDKLTSYNGQTITYDANGNLRGIQTVGETGTVTIN